MIHINYINEFADIYTEIYKLLIICSCKFVPNTLDYTLLSSQIKQKINEFNNLQNNYLDVIETTFQKNIIFESVDWEKYIKIVDSEYNYLNFNIKFYVDYPNLNKYGIIIQERNYEQHYTFTQDSSNISNQKIILANNIHIIINDEIIDDIRKGHIPNNGRIRMSYNNSKHILLRIPFHKDRLYIKNIDWVNSVITSMEMEFEKFLNFSNTEKINKNTTQIHQTQKIIDTNQLTYTNNNNNNNNSYSKTKTCFNL